MNFLIFKERGGLAILIKNSLGYKDLNASMCNFIMWQYEPTNNPLIRFDIAIAIGTGQRAQLLA